MSTQQCPQCGKIVSLEDSFCRSCGAKLPPQNVELQTPQLAKPQPQPVLQKAASAPTALETSGVSGVVWRKHVDTWNGFSLERPSGWEVRATHDAISVCYDARGLTSAMIRPLQLPLSGAEVTADILAHRMVDMMRAQNTTFAAWQMNPAEKTYIAMHKGQEQVLLRIRSVEEGQELVGVLSVIVDGQTALISGFQAPKSLIETMKPIFQSILVSFQSIPRTPRNGFVEPSEQAFTAMLPEEWKATGKVLRTPDAGIIFQFRATDPDGALSAEIPGRYYFFQEEAKGWLGKLVVPQKYLTRPFMPASVFLERIIAPEMRPRYPDLRIERISNRADIAASLVADGLQMGEWVQAKNLTAASMQCTYTENGVKYRQRTYVAVQRWPMTRVWRAMIRSIVRTPHDQFVQNYSMLEGITDSIHPDMQWVQAQRQKAQEKARQDAQRAGQQIIGALQVIQGIQQGNQGAPGQKAQPQMPMQQPWIPGAGMSMPMGMGIPQMPQGQPVGQGGQGGLVGQGLSPQQQMAMQQMWQQAQLKQLEIMRNANQDVFNMHQAGWQRQMAQQEQQFQNFDQVIRGYQYMHSPYNGNQYEVPIGYNNYWANGLGQVIGSNLGDSPGYGFQKLEPM